MNNALCGPQSTEHYPQVSSEEISRPNNERRDGIRHNVGRVAGTYRCRRAWRHPRQIRQTPGNEARVGAGKASGDYERARSAKRVSTDIH